MAGSKLKASSELCWKPIETAPKDGRWIIAGDISPGCYEVFIAYYGMRTSRDRRPCWLRWYDEKVYPTHWLAEFDDIKVCNE